MGGCFGGWEDGRMGGWVGWLILISVQTTFHFLM